MRLSSSSRNSSSAAPRGQPSFLPASQRVDLHAHSTWSDGEHSPEEVAEFGTRAGLAAMALTDHDCVDGLQAFQQAAQGFTPILGVEISARDQDQDVHLLGLFIDPADPRLRERLQGLARAREVRMQTMIEKLHRIGIPISRAEIEAQCKQGTVGRPHVAMALVERGAARSVDEAFRLYLRRRTPAYVPMPGPSPPEVIQWIHDAGGVAVLAHPGLGRTLDPVAAYVESGLDGIEVWHPKHGPGVQQACLELVERLGLVPSGGSDYHGPRVGDSQVGQEPVPYEVLERLHARRPRR
jgi:3',5'-nucleoside bisphosphate phosphatase